MGVEASLSYFDDSERNMRRDQLVSHLELIADIALLKLDPQLRSWLDAPMKVFRRNG